MKDFRTLTVWQRSHAFTLKVYAATKHFPKEELFGLTSQLRRSSSSIPTNIAEGCGRGTERDFVRFLQIAFGSANEADYQLLLANDLGLMEEKAVAELSADMVEIKRMLASLIRKIEGELR